MDCAFVNRDGRAPIVKIHNALVVVQDMVSALLRRSTVLGSVSAIMVGEGLDASEWRYTLSFANVQTIVQGTASAWMACVAVMSASKVQIAVTCFAQQD